MIAQKSIAEFDRDEPMLLARRALRPQRAAPGTINPRRQRLEFHRPWAERHGTIPREIQAQFDAARMKTPRPLERLRGGEFVPLHTDTQVMEPAVQQVPIAPDSFPNRRFADGHAPPPRGGRRRASTLCRYAGTRFSHIIHKIIGPH